MKSNYFLLHGSFSSPFSNWIPWLRKKIEEDGRVCYTPDMPSGVGFQTYENWSQLMQCYVDAGLLHEETIIFAHSIAPVFICKFLVEHKIKVKKLILVCGFNHYLGIDADYDAVNKSMYFDSLKDVKKYCSSIVCFYSDNDPYVPFAIEEEFAETIADQKNVIAGGGHLNSESGFSEFNELLLYL